MSRFNSIVLAIGVVLSASTLTADAAVYSGTLKSVSSDGQEIVVAFSSESGKPDMRFTLATTSRLMVDGKSAKPTQLKVGAAVSVFATSAGKVTRVTVRTADSNSATAQRSTTGRKARSTRKTSNQAARSEGPATLPVSWSQFRGPNRDNLSSETGLLKSWPKGGPPLAWKAQGLGEAYSTVSLADGKIFTMGNLGDEEHIIALDLNTGNKVWSARNGAAYHQGAGNGPRGTPTIDGERLYALGGNGDLSCVSTENGEIHWQKNILQEFGGKNITWGICESVLIDGDRLICTPGGSEATIVALDKMTGNVIWKSQVPSNPLAGYASPIVIEVGGVRQYVVFTSKAVVGVRANDGTPLWGDKASANGTANCSTPLFHKNHIFSASAYGTGGALLSLQSSRGTTTSKMVYHTKDMKNHHGGMVIVDDYLYGSSDSILTCMNLATGKVMWRERSSKGSVAFAEGLIYFRNENGPMVLLEATPAAYRELGRFDQPDRSRRPAWAHPVVADGKLFLRDMDVLLCYDVKAK